MWDLLRRGEFDGLATGVYVPRRDTDSRMAQLAGGRLFPGDHSPAVFDVEETAGRYRIAARSTDGTMSVRVNAHDADLLPSGSIFGDLASASRFFHGDATGHSPSRHRTAFDAMRLDVEEWKVTPLACDEVQSGFFEDRHAFPDGSVVFDHALLMRRAQARWTPQKRIAA